MKNYLHNKLELKWRTEVICTFKIKIVWGKTHSSSLYLNTRFKLKTNHQMKTTILSVKKRFRKLTKHHTSQVVECSYATLILKRSCLEDVNSDALKTTSRYFEQVRIRPIRVTIIAITITRDVDVLKMHNKLREVNKCMPLLGVNREIHIWKEISCWKETSKTWITRVLSSKLVLRRKRHKNGESTKTRRYWLLAVRKKQTAMRSAFLLFWTLR